MADENNDNMIAGGKNLEEEQPTDLQKKIEDKIAKDEKRLKGEELSGELSKDRTHMSEHRTKMSEHRTQMSEHRTGLSEKRTGMSDIRTHLSYQRTALSYERTLMSWIRTATSMITFGFTIYKFFDEMSRAANRPNKIFTPRMVGLTMILFGFISLLVAQIQHEMALKELKRNDPKIQRSLSSVLSVLILLFGLILFLATLFRQ